MKLPKYDINKYDPKRMMAIPAVLFGIALVIVGITFAMTGMPVTPGIDFAGGTAVTIHTDDTKEEIVAFYSGYDLKFIDEGIGSGGYYLKFGPMSNEDMMKFNNYTLSKYPEASIDQIGANFGATLQSQAMWAILFAFIGMAVVVFLAFRKVIPAITVVSAGIADITITAAVMNLVGIELSLATTAALLMLIGYSVDSNILLTTKVLKRQGNLEEKMEGAYRTGIIMTTTTLAAIVAMFIVAFIGQVPTLYSIAAVLIIGLISDIIFTWGFNAGVLRMYLSGSEKPQAMPKQSKKDNRGAKQ
ncbi:protein translocase subunit SecF [uncultured Methanocorpusculum sp.]|nr:protein translocase subunit SecF [uncultured Methanocorpusculum sp.]